MKTLYYVLSFVTSTEVSYLVTIDPSQGVVVSSRIEDALKFSSEEVVNQYMVDNGVSYLKKVKYFD